MFDKRNMLCDQIRITEKLLSMNATKITKNNCSTNKLLTRKFVLNQTENYSHSQHNLSETLTFDHCKHDQHDSHPYGLLIYINPNMQRIENR